MFNIPKISEYFIFFLKIGILYSGDNLAKTLSCAWKECVVKSVLEIEF